VEGGARVDAVELLAGDERPERLGRTEHERLIRPGLGGGGVDHAGRAVEAYDVPVGHEAGHHARELPAAAPDVEQPVIGLQRQRLEERLVVHLVMGAVGRVRRRVPLR
jgi:hypothetical protein